MIVYKPLTYTTEAKVDANTTTTSSNLGLVNDLQVKNDNTNEVFLQPGLNKSNPINRKGVKRDLLAHKLSTALVGVSCASSAVSALDTAAGGLDSRQRQITETALRHQLYGGKYAANKSEREQTIEAQSLDLAVANITYHARLPSNVFGLLLVGRHFKQKLQSQYSFHIFLGFLCDISDMVHPFFLLETFMLLVM